MGVRSSSRSLCIEGATASVLAGSSAALIPIPLLRSNGTVKAGVFSMARLIFGMNVSLDGYVDHDTFAPDDVLFRHWIKHVRGLSGSAYGRSMYEIMRCWDKDRSERTSAGREFAEAWRRQPKWAVSRTLASVGPSTTLIQGHLESQVRDIARGDHRVEARPYARPVQPRPCRRGPAIHRSGRPREWQALLRRSAIATSLGRQRADRKQRDSIDIRTAVIGGLLAQCMRLWSLE